MDVWGAAHGCDSKQESWNELWAWIIYLCTAWPCQLSGQKSDQEVPNERGKAAPPIVCLWDKGHCYCVGGLVGRDDQWP